MKSILACVLFQLAVYPVQTLAGNECAKGKEPGKHFSFGTEKRLPALAKRKILGVWQYGPKLTISLDEVSGEVYLVYRTKYCSSGDTGEPLQKIDTRLFKELPGGQDRYYQIYHSGDLVIAGKDGEPDKLFKSEMLWPDH